MKLLKNKYIFAFIFVTLVFFYPLLFGKFPIPSDALVGLYHPWRDFFADNFPNGIPFKNPLITDPIRQQYPYRRLAVLLLKDKQLPLWNPYNFAGTPLFANIQTAVLYPLNMFFLIFPFTTAWSVLILLQTPMAGFFTYFYLKSLKIDSRASLLGAVAFALSGFMVAWQQWNTIGHVALWLPLILLAKDKLLEKFSLQWAVTLIFAESSMILAGHLQTAFYVLVFTTIHLLLKAWYITKQPKKFLLKLLPFCITALFVYFITIIQLLPTIQFILHSARSFDLPDWHRIDWFIPWQHVVQFFVPDFFGNPATGNYWGVWNYGEFIGYIGVIPLFFAFLALLFRRDKKTLYFGVGLAISLLFGLPTIIGKLPYQISIPFIATLQPSRIIILIDFCLAVLGALGFDYFLRLTKQKKTFFLSIGFILLYVALIIGVFSKQSDPNMHVAFRNTAASAGLGSLLVIALGVLYFFPTQKFKTIIVCGFLLLTVFDLIRFGWKFTPFTDRSLLFPNTKVIEFLQQNLGEYRFMTTDRRIMPPNVATAYRIADVSGYDPLYLQNYGELIAAWTRNRPDITPGSFNRILTPENYNSFLADLLGVKYVLSLKDEVNPKLRFLFQEGQTRVYENTAVVPRVFLAESVVLVDNKQEAIEQLFTNADTMEKVAIVENPSITNNLNGFLKENEYAKIQSYTENKIIIETSAMQDRLLVVSDIYYPSWIAYIDGNRREIFKTNYALRGVVVPQGIHTVEFKIQLLSL